MEFWILVMEFFQLSFHLYMSRTQWRNYGRQWRQLPPGASPEGAPGDQVVYFFTNILTINQIQMPNILLYKLDSMLNHGRILHHMITMDRTPRH